MNRVWLVLSLFFIHDAGIQCMELIPVQTNWHLLQPEIVRAIADNLDFLDCNNMRQSCQHFRTCINAEYYKKKVDHLMNIAKELDIDTYTRNMIFFNLSPKNDTADRGDCYLFQHHKNCYNYGCKLYGATNGKNREDTKSINALLKTARADWGKIYKKEYLENLYPIVEYSSNQSIIRLFLHLDVNHKNKKGNSLLHFAKWKVCSDLLQRTDIEVNNTNNEGETPLHYAIKHPYWQEYSGHLHIGGAGINRWDQAETLLQDKRTDIFITTNKGRTALHYAAKYGSNRTKGFQYLSTKKTGFYILKLIVERLQQDHQHDLYAMDNEGKTALYLAIENGHLDATKFLFPLFPDDIKFAVDEHGRTLLHIAAMNKWNASKLIKYLLSGFPEKIKYLRDIHSKTFLDYYVDKADGLGSLRSLMEKDDEYPIDPKDMNKFLTYSSNEWIVASIKNGFKQFFSDKYVPLSLAFIVGTIIYLKSEYVFQEIVNE